MAASSGDQEGEASAENRGAAKSAPRLPSRWRSHYRLVTLRCRARPLFALAPLTPTPTGVSFVATF